jgi:branched-subunit amino acid transport protein AzlD
LRLIFFWCLQEKRQTKYVTFISTKLPCNALSVVPCML